MVLANDGFGALGVGGIVLGKTDKIAMVREQLDIACSSIQVSYDFLNESDEDVTTPVIFPLPPYPANPAESGVIAHGQPAGFTVLSDGKAIKYATRVRAMLKGVDITNKLQKMGFTEKQIARFPFDESLLSLSHELKVPKRQADALAHAGLLSEGGAPTWEIQVSFVWSQVFRARKHVHVVHSYRPFVAEGTASGYANEYGKNIGNIPVENFCPSASQLDQLDKLFSNKSNLDGYGQIRGAIVEYILTTANTWKDGIRDFTMRVHTGNADEVVALCFPVPLTRKQDNVYEVHLNNFKPNQDLRIFLGNQKTCPESSYGEAPTFSE
jgi:hypothetical protein